MKYFFGPSILLIVGILLMPLSVSAVFNFDVFEYTETSLNLTARDGLPSGITFNDDGTKLYVGGRFADTVYQYTLSTAYDMTTASYDNVSFTPASGDNPYGFIFGDGGTKLYTIDSGLQNVYQYDVGTPYDLSTATNTGEAFYDVSGQVGTGPGVAPTGISFNNDGTKMFVSEYYSEEIFEYDVSTAWDVTSASYSGTSFTMTQVNNAYGHLFSDDGMSLIALSESNDTIYLYDLSTAWDLSTISYSGSSGSIAGQASIGTAVTTNGANDRLYVYDLSTKFVYEYQILPIPVVTTLSPADDATGVTTTANLIMTFSETVSAATGTIDIYTATGTLFESISVTSSQVTGSGSDTITINPNNTFSVSTSYYVYVSSTAFINASSTAFAGISVSTTWNFTTTDLEPPSSLQYTTPNTYIVNTAIATLSPIVSGGAVASYTISPALPAGLSISPVTGQISGIPLAAAGLTTYTVTAANDSGSTTFDIQITVAEPVEEEEEEEVEEETRGGGGTVVLVPPVAMNFSGAATSHGTNGLAPVLVGTTLHSNANPTIVDRMAISFDDPTFATVSVIPYTDSQDLTIPAAATTIYVRYYSYTGHRSQDFELAIPKEVTQVPTVTATNPLACTVDFSKMNEPIKFGASNNANNVRLLEQFLNTYEQANLPVDGVYGEADLAAVITWQETYAADILAPWGITKGTGYIFTTSLAKIQEIHAAACRAAAVPKETPAPSVSSNGAFTTPLAFARPLERGMRGEDVRLLQQVLNHLGFTVDTTGVGSPGNESDYFGQLTYDAVIRFQAAYAEQILAPLGITTPTGYVGPSTVAHMTLLLQ